MSDLMIRPEDAEERDLIALDAEFCGDYGPPQKWVFWQVQQYLDAKTTIHARYAKQVAS